MLRFNEAEQAFVLFTDDDKTAIAAGLTLSTTIRGPDGKKVYYTSDPYDRDKFAFNPYAVLEFWDQADGQAREKLAGLHRDYESSWAQETGFVAPHPPGKEPMPFQHAGVEYCLGRRHSLLGDAMGLGKTIQAILLANAMDARRILIVCPASIRRQWVREILEWSTLRDPSWQTIMKSSDGVRPDANFTVVSYDLLRNPGIHAALRGTKFDLGVFDEAHYMKTLDAARTRAVFDGGVKPNSPDTYSFYENGLWRNIDRMVGLTGTALPNRPREAYTLARGFHWEAIDYLAYDPFCFRFNPSKQEFYIDPRTGETLFKNLEERGRLHELNARLRCNLLVRRLAEDVLDQLPDKRYEMTYIEPDGAIKAVLAREALIDFDPMDLWNPDFTMDGTPISTLRREMGEAMVPRCVEYIKMLLDIAEVPKIVLYAHHNSVMDALIEALSKYGVVVHRGGMTPAKKEEAKFEFIHGRPRLFLGQLDTMEGVDGLQSACSNAVFVEPAWTSGRNEQCVGRLYRHLQHDNVLARFLLVQGSFNEKVLNTVLDKAHNLYETLDRRLV